MSITGADGEALRCYDDTPTEYVENQQLNFSYDVALATSCQQRLYL